MPLRLRRRLRGVLRHSAQSPAGSSARKPPIRLPSPRICANCSPSSTQSSRGAQAWRPSTATPPQPRQSLLINDGYADCIRPAEARTHDGATVIGIAASDATVHNALHSCAVRSASSRSLQIGDGVRDCLKLRRRYTELLPVAKPLVQQA